MGLMSVEGSRYCRGTGRTAWTSNAAGEGSGRGAYRGLRREAVTCKARSRNPGNSQKEQSGPEDEATLRLESQSDCTDRSDGHAGDINAFAPVPGTLEVISVLAVFMIAVS